MGFNQGNSKKKKTTIWDFPLETEEQVDELHKLIFDRGMGKVYKNYLDNMRQLMGDVEFEKAGKITSEDDELQELMNSKKGGVFIVWNEKTQSVEKQVLTKNEAIELFEKGVELVALSDYEAFMASEGKKEVMGRAKSLVFPPKSQGQQSIRYMRVRYSASLKSEGADRAILEMVRRVQEKGESSDL